VGQLRLDRDQLVTEIAELETALKQATEGDTERGRIERDLEQRRRRVAEIDEQLKEET
jgi:hypothetical protein